MCDAGRGEVSAGLLAGLAGFLAVGAIQDALAEAEALRGVLEAFVGCDELNGVLQVEIGGRDEADGDRGTLRADVVSVFSRSGYTVRARAASVARSCDDGDGANRAASRRGSGGRANDQNMTSNFDGRRSNVSAGTGVLLTKETIMNYFKLVCVVCVLALLPALRAAEKMDRMVGCWEGGAPVIVSWSDQRDLLVSIEIAADGKVTGRVGDAVLVDGRLKKKTNWFGGEREDQTTHIVRAALKGPIVDAEGISRSEIFIHLRLEEGMMSGSLATSGTKVGGKESMALTATPLRLSKVE